MTNIEDQDTGDDDELDRTLDLSANEPKQNSLESTTLGSSSSSSTPQGIPARSEYSESLGSWIGPYQLKEEIGAGGMGTVFLAEQVEPVRRKVALKIIKAGMDSEQVIARFELERQALSMMEHPNIARVLDAGTTDKGRPYFVMELVHGEPITTFCDRLKLDIKSRLEIFCDVCHAVQHAHQKGIIHRDLKPTNILVSEHNETGIPKIIDFGVAKATSQRLNEKTMFTEFGEVVGTLEYMSPEQAQMSDLNIDTRSDIYSLGVLLYELLTGSTPLNRQAVRDLGYIEILSRITEEEATKPSSRLTQTGNKLQLIADARSIDSRRLFHTIRGDLDWIVLKSLEKDRTRRYDTATGFADDIKRYLKAQPVIARSPTGWYLLKKFVARHRASVMASAAIFMTLLVGIGMTIRQARRAMRAEKTVASQLEELKKSTRIEKENAELQREIDRENEIRLSNLVAQVSETIGRGQWNEGMKQIEAIQEEFDELPLEISMLRLYALDGRSKLDELRAEILRLEKHPEAEKFKPQLQLWHGYSFLSSENQGSDEKDLIQAAIDGGLDPADRFFAEGLIADSLVIAATKYEKALRLSPFHSKARIQLIITFILLGRYDDAQRQIQIAKSLFSDDQRYFVADVVSHALANNIDETNKSLADLEQRFPAVDLRDIRALIGLSQSVNGQFLEFDRTGFTGWLAIVPKGIPLFQDSKGMRLIPVPEFQKVHVFNAYTEFASSFLNPLQPIMSLRHSNETMVRKCQNSFEIHPDGVFKCFEGWGLFSLGEFGKSSAAFDEAIKSDSLFPEIKRQALYGAFLSRVAQHKKNPAPKTLKEAIVFLESYLARNIERHRAMPMFEACCAAGRWDLSREIANRMILQGESNKDWLENLVNAAIAQERYGIALNACDEILQNEEDANIVAKRSQIVEKILAATKSEQDSQNKN